MPTAKPRDIPSLREAAHQFLRLVRLIRPYWSRLLQGMLLALILGLLGMVTPYLTKLLIDEVYPTENVNLMHVLVGGLLGLGLGSALLGSLRNYFSLYVDTRLNSATRLFFFNHLQHLEARFFDEHQVGEVNSRFQDVGQALQSISRIFQTVFVQGVYLVLVPPVLFFLEWRLALVSLVTLPLILGITALSGRILRRFWKKSSEAHADLNAFQIETLSHVRTFKTMGLEHEVYRRAEGFTTHAMEQQIRAGGLSQAFNATTSTLHGLNTALFTWFGWTLILGRQMSLGDFMAFSAYLGYLYGPLNQVIQLFSDFQQSAVHLGRMFEYLDAPVEQDPQAAYEPPPAPERTVAGTFRFHDVGFAYDHERQILHDLDFALPAGSTTALVGPSGSGKTTLLRLLTRLQTPTSGHLTLDGFPLAEMRLSDLRQQLAVVWQDVSLLKGTLWDNLVLGSEEPRRDEVERMVRLCGLGSFFDDLPEGFATSVSEWGTSLSAGQRQRVALARALLRDAPILLLDEATANIDVETEMDILRKIFDQMRQTTVFFVTHRLATAALADQVCVLENGRLQGFGKHRDLIESCATYQRMVSASHNSEGRFRRPEPPAVSVAT